MNREIDIHKVQHSISELKIEATDEKGIGNANSHYLISGFRLDIETKGSPHTDTIKELHIPFQDGAVKDVGLNGVTIESLLAICADRLTGFQTGNYPCEENGRALSCIHAALHHLKERTVNRINRGVEGEYKS